LQRKFCVKSAENRRESLRIAKNAKTGEFYDLENTLKRDRSQLLSFVGLLQSATVVKIGVQKRGAFSEKGSGTNSAEHPPGHLAIGS
jgi:hypothetical protein